jgi:N-acylneuraminate cytidylyltransferase
MLVRTIEALKACKLVDRIIVTTDSQEYADLAHKHGAEIPFLRSASLAGDSSNTIDVVVDVIERIQLSGDDRVACVYATNPLLDSRIIDLGQRLLMQSSANSYVTPLVKYGFPPQRSISLKNQYQATMTNPEFMYEHSQNLAPLFHESAQFWWAYAATWVARIGMQENILPIILKEWMQQDIDTIDDWIAAEAKFDYKMLYPAAWDQEVENIISKYLLA